MIVCYAQREKGKSMRVLEAFCEGSGAHLVYTNEPLLLPGAAVFYGIRESYKHLWLQVKQECRDFFFVDNAYFDATREQQFRVTKNRIQHTGRGETDGKRFAALGITIKPKIKQNEGSKIIICAQSDEFMDLIANDPGWLARVSVSMKRHCGEENVIVRRKNEQRPLAEDLRDAKLVVTWSSAAAIVAHLEGIPVACNEQCCVTYSEDVLKWAGVLADNQWTLDEFRSGAFKKALDL